MIVGCSIYLYPSKDKADQGAASGGSGFLVSSPSNDGTNRWNLYAVTNKHVIEGGCSVLRLNRKDGGMDTIITRWGEWRFHPSYFDVAVKRLELDESLKFWSVPSDILVTRQIIADFNLGVGDETFLIGRLIGHDGRQKNAPVARFGNISLMADPKEPIKCAGGPAQEGFLVECRSLSGFSGSPVFIFTGQVFSGDSATLAVKAAPSDIQMSQGGDSVNGKPISVTGAGPWLLGIDWGHFPRKETVFDEKGLETQYRVISNTGIACVLPAWHIMDLLNTKI